MSNPLNTFIMRSPAEVVEQDRMMATSPNPPCPTYLPQPNPTPQSFFTGTPDNFLSLPEQMEGEGEALLGSSDGEGVPQGSLLYLDSTSALHVLVHHLPQAPHQPTPPQLVEEEGSQEQFVVVGALKNGELTSTPSPPDTCHVSVESILEEELVGGGEIYLPQGQDPTPVPQHLSPTPVLTLVGDGTGGEDSGTTGITIDTVPHITLEEIIQKFASSPDSPIDAIDEPSTTTTTITAITSHPSPPSPPSVKVGVLQEGKDKEEDEDKDECWYDVVVTYRCRMCGEVYGDKTSLLHHHLEQHKQRDVIKIRVTTSDTPTTIITSSSTTSTTLSRAPPPEPDKDQGEVGIHSCAFCSKDFLSLRDCQEHISKEHPTKKTEEGGPKHYQPQGTPVVYPTQPGLLIGHRNRAALGQVQGEAGGEGEVQSKRKVKPPTTLQDQFWLQKQRPKPVCTTEVKTHRCSMSTCKYKFSNEANLEAHRECHGGGLGKGKERGFTCPHCALRYDKWSLCQLHLWKCHERDIDLLTCGICHTYKTCTQQRLLVHQKIHSDNKDHLCKTCGKAFKQLAQLLNHQVIHLTKQKDLPGWAEKTYCEDCQRWFKDRKALKLHIDIVHLKKKPYPCPHCPYRCSKKYGLKVHIRKHTGERPHRCPLCGWKARDHNTMRRHKLGHQDLKPFRCPAPLCQFECRYPNYFKRHMARRHPKNELPYRCQFCPLETASLQDYLTHSMKHEKELAEEAIRHKTAAADTLMDITTVPIEEGSIDPTTTTVPTTTIDVTTTTDNTKKSLPNPIDFNHKVGFITIKFDDPSPSPCPTREEGKPGGDTEGTVVVEEEDGEEEGVSLPQVVLSENNGHYILGLPTDFTPAMTESDGECHLNSHTHHHHQDKVMKDSHHTTTTHHPASPHHHLHSTSQH